MRKCVKCQVVKEDCDFYLRNKQSHLRQSSCKSCTNKDCRERAKKKRNLNPKPRGGQRKYRLNESLFEDIDSEEKAYWLGFLFADGYNSEDKRTITLGLAEQDANHIQKFKTFLSCDCPIRIATPRRPKEQPMHVLNVYSTKMSIDLCKHGCMQSKTFKICFPTFINKSLWKHFIRGYFDGDGWVGKYRSKNSTNCSISIVSNKRFLLQLQSILKSEIEINSQISKTFNGNRSDVRCLYSGGNNQVLKFLNWIYDGANIFLERKFLKYKEIASYLSVSK